MECGLHAFTDIPGAGGRSFVAARRSVARSTTSNITAPYRGPCPHLESGGDGRAIHGQLGSKLRAVQRHSWFERAQGRCINRWADCQRVAEAGYQSEESTVTPACIGAPAHGGYSS